jgi:polysaccharide export outer membrane protein
MPIPTRLFPLRAVALLAWLFCAAGSAPALAQGASDYALGAGDVIKITVFQNPDLATETRVSEAGTITFPLIGSVGVGGQAPSEVEQLIAKRLRDGGFVNRPQVNVVVLQFKSMQVSVLGQVNRPGKYPLEQTRNRLTEVLAVAGGVTTLGADVVTLITHENGKERRLEIDLPALLQSGDKTKDAVLKSGDVIFVPRYPVFYIHGEVQRPGQYRLERDMTVQQALAVGGGLTIRGTQRGLQISRREGNGKPLTREAQPAEEVRADDVIFVKESLF